MDFSGFMESWSGLKRGHMTGSSGSSEHNEYYNDHYNGGLCLILGHWKKELNMG